MCDCVCGCEYDFVAPIFFQIYIVICQNDLQAFRDQTD